MKNKYIQQEISNSIQVKQDIRNKRNRLNYKKKKLKIRNVKTIDSEAFKILKSVYSISGFHKPYLNFKQVKRGVFKCDQLKGLYIKIKDVEFESIKKNIFKRSIMYIIDLRAKTRITSKHLIYYKKNEMSKNNVKANIYNEYLRLENFQNEENQTKFYFSSKFKLIGKEFFEFLLVYHNNEISLINPSLGGRPYEEAGLYVSCVLLRDVDCIYLRDYNKDMDLFENPYLDFFIK